MGWEYVSLIYHIIHEADMQVDAIGMVMAVSAGLSIIMTVFVFPYLHHRIPENLFLRLCTCFRTVIGLHFPDS